MWKKCQDAETCRGHSAHNSAHSGKSSRIQYVSVVSCCKRVPNDSLPRAAGQNNDPYRTQNVHALLLAEYQRCVDFASGTSIRMQRSRISVDMFRLRTRTLSPVRALLILTDHKRGPFQTCTSSFQRQLSANVWAGILNDHLVVSYLLPQRLDDKSCHNFLRELFCPILTIHEVGKSNLSDRASAHFNLDLRKHLDATFKRWWTGPVGSTAWLPRSRVLSYLVVLLWSHAKILIYKCMIETTMNLFTRTAVVAIDIQEVPCVFANVSHFLSRWCEAYIKAGESSYEQFLSACALVTFLPLLIKCFLKYFPSFLC